MDNNTNQADNLFDLTYDSAAGNYLKQAAFWARICAVIAFISGGLTLIKSFTSASANALAGTFTVIISLIVIAVTILLNVFLLRFANNTTNGLEGNNQEKLNEGLGNLGTYLKIVGILMIIAIAFVILYFFAAVFFMSRMR